MFCSIKLRSIIFAVESYCNAMIYLNGKLKAIGMSRAHVGNCGFWRAGTEGWGDFQITQIMVNFAIVNPGGCGSFRQIMLLIEKTAQG